MTTSTRLGALIRSLRAGVRLTQEELAEKAGISVRTISDIERGLRRSVYRDTAERLAEALEVDDAEKVDFVSVARGRMEPRTRSRGFDSRNNHRSRGRIPLPPTPLVGREREMDILMSAFRDGVIRSVTLTGPGGIGKTRLAAEAAVGAQEMFRDGVVFVSLSSAEDSMEVVPLVAEVLEIAEPEGATVVDISSHLSAARVLLVLDTFEHVLDAAASIADLLASCEGLTVLATSREPLRIRGEHVVAVPALDLPPEGSTDISASASGRLLLERARAAKPDLVVDEHSAALLTDICRRLNGLPLAIELAASRIHHLPLITLRQQLDSRLSVLTRGAADLPRRQRTMRDTIAWSYDLLDPAERSLFRSVSVFKGGWTLDAAEEVSATFSEGDVVETLSALVDKSLVAVTGAEDTQPRYSMTDLLAEFASEQRNEHDETSTLLLAHALFFLSLAERAEKGIGSSAQEDWYRRLLAEHDNLRTAIRWSIDEGDPEVGLRLAAALWQFWRAEGHLAEGRSWLDRALGSAVDAPIDIRADALWGACWLAFHQDDLRAARRYSRELLEITHGHEGSIMRRNALTVQGMLHIAEGAYPSALEPLERSVSICEGVGSTWHLATSKLNLALASLHLRRLDDASRLLDDALDTYTQLGDDRFVARVHAYRGHLALLQGDKRKAKELFSEALKRFTTVRDEGGIAESLEGLAAVSAAANAMEGAALLWGAASQARDPTMSKTLPFERALIDGWLDDARAVLSDETWSILLSDGATMDIEDAIGRVDRAGP